LASVLVDFRSVLFLIGVLLSALSAAMAVPLMAELFVYQTPLWRVFAVSLCVSGFFGSTMILANRPSVKINLGMREAFLMTSLSWVILSIFSGVPLFLSQPLGLSFIDATFEAVSALTTTGSTVMRNLDNTSNSILLWRAMLQWFGGIGIIVMAMIIFPTLRIGGMQLFRSEFSDRSEKILPRVSQIATAIVTAYAFFTVACGLLLCWAGMPVFDAICHAMCTVSTGGFSTKDSSIGFYNNPLIEFIIIIFMIIGGSTLILYVRLWNGDAKALRKDHQLHAYLLVLFVASVFACLWQFFENNLPFWTSVRQGLFACVSCVTSCGFVSDDYGKWGHFPIMFFFILSFIGGCTGSTSGGIKIFRFQVLFSLTRSHLLQLRRPHGVYVPLYQNQKISQSVAFSVFAFLTLYALCLVLIAFILSAFGLDFMTSLTGAASSLSNVGPGLGELIGPHTSFSALNAGPKIVLMGAMILGRLELLTILVLFMPSFWRN
jgi:trk system potassium uptake protein TrkH